MARRKTRTSWKVSLSFAQIGALAEHHVGKFVSDGLKLQQSSGVWRKANGSGTGRFVYRSDSGTSMVFTVKGLQLPAGAD